MSGKILTEEDLERLELVKGISDLPYFMMSVRHFVEIIGREPTEHTWINERARIIRKQLPPGAWEEGQDES